jgi:hypothetical protein
MQLLCHCPDSKQKIVSQLGPVNQQDQHKTKSFKISRETQNSMASPPDLRNKVFAWCIRH